MAEPRRTVVKDHPNLSPSPEAPAPEDARLHSLARMSRATSEARSEPCPVSPDQLEPSAPRAGDMCSPTTGQGEAAGYRNSRAGSEVPQRGGELGVVPAAPSYLSSRAGSEVPERNHDFMDAISQRSSRAGSEAPQRLAEELAGNASFASVRSSRAGSEAPDRSNPNPAQGQQSTSNTTAVPAGSPTSGSTAGNNNTTGTGTNASSTATAQPIPPRRTVKVAKPAALASATNPATAGERVVRSYKQPPRAFTVQEHIRDVEHRMYHTVKRGTSAFQYYQVLHYPVETNEPESPTEPAPALTLSEPPAGFSSKEPSPQPRSSTGGSPEAVGSSSHNSSSPSPVFDEAAFNATYDGQNFLKDAGEKLNESFSVALHVDEPAQQSVSVLAMTTLPDPISGVPVLGLCLGDYTGHIEYFEFSSSESNNKFIRQSRSAAAASCSMPGQSGYRDASANSLGASESVDSVGTNNTIMQDMRGREIARRHSHKAFVKSINALTSVTVEPCVKCLSFVRPQCSPSMISYLTANERVIKLFHVRRAGLCPFSVFPGMESVVGPTFKGSRYFARLPPQSAILPIKEYGPVYNSIQALSASADGETFMSVEDLQVFWWSFEASDTTKNVCIADLRPASGALDEVDELVTAACFHPTHSSLFLLSRSSGILNVGDLRDPPSRSKRQYAITTQVLSADNPTTYPSYDEILCSISAASFLGPDHAITRDYLSLKLWDLRKPDRPYVMVPVMNYVSRFLDQLYDNDAIFDRFPVAVDDVSGTVVTGLYDGAVAAWQPLKAGVNKEDELVHYRADPFVAPEDTARGGRVTEQELEQTLVEAWMQHVSHPADGLPGGLMPPPAAEETPEPFTNKVLNLSIAPGGERFGYTYKNGRLVYVFERKGQPSRS